MKIKVGNPQVSAKDRYSDEMYGKMAKVLIKLNCDLCRGGGTSKPGEDCNANSTCCWYPLHPYREDNPNKPKPLCEEIEEFEAKLPTPRNNQ